jgi:hypothetical protein
MSKEQGKFKWYDIRPIYQFICIIVILLILAGIVVMAAGGHPTPGKEGAYDIVRTELQNAVKDYQNKNNGELPTINGTVTINGSDYRIINICPLLTLIEESLQTVRDSLWCGNGSNDDNWDGGCAECNVHSSYIWAVDDEGNVYSTCVGERCNTSGIDGFQGFP